MVRFLVLPLTGSLRTHVAKMLGRALYSGSWSTLVAWRRALLLHGRPLTHLVDTNSVGCSAKTVRGTFSNWSAPPCDTGSFAKHLHGSTIMCGLEEFFPRSENLIEEGEKTGTHAKILIPLCPSPLNSDTHIDMHKVSQNGRERTILPDL